MDIVADAGTGFAFPSQTLYLSRDQGLDAERRAVAEDVIKSWREEGKLPFPTLATARIQELAGSLDYPPTGSTNRL
jgi:MscS family membrane protein